MTGQSTRQILAAPADAYYIVPTYMHVTYIAELAAFLKRPDLAVVPMSEVSIATTSRRAVFDHKCDTWVGGIYYRQHHATLKAWARTNDQKALLEVMAKGFAQ